MENINPKAYRIRIINTPGNTIKKLVNLLNAAGNCVIYDMSRRMDTSIAKKKKKKKKDDL